MSQETSKLSAEEQQKLDAERWRALLAMSRIRWFGSAGFDPETRKQYSTPDDYRHADIGFFTTYWTPERPENEVERAGRLQAIKMLTEMADVMRAIQAGETGGVVHHLEETIDTHTARDAANYGKEALS